MNKINPIVSLITPEDIGADLLVWVENNKSTIDKHPALLFRGFECFSEQFLFDLSSVFSEPMDYVYRSTPRTQKKQGVYTATEYPKESTIPQHCENAYQATWPLRLYFQCLQPSEQGGETPLSDIRKVTLEISGDTQDKFKEQGVMYVRNYSPGLDIPWQTVFQTTEEEEVEKFCTDHKIKFKWKGKDSLRTEQICQATAIHPLFGDELWFNQAHLFHITHLDKNLQKILLDTYTEEGLPRNAYYGNGEPIEESVLLEIRNAYDKYKCDFKWQTNDILIIDNMLCSHGRNPYSGDRNVLVSMNIPVGPV